MSPLQLFMGNASLILPISNEYFVCIDRFRHATIDTKLWPDYETILIQIFIALKRNIRSDEMEELRE